MTIFWVDLLPKIQAWITEYAVSGNDPMWLEQGARWTNQPASSTAADTAVSIDLSITSSQDGEWETRYVDDPANGGQRAILSGNREFVLQIKCNAFQSDFARWALTYAERIRTRLQNTVVIDRLEDEGITFWKYGSIQNLEGVEDGQAVSISVLDLFGRVGFEEVPEDAPLVPLFLSLQFRSKLSGYTPGAPPNFEDVAPPPAPTP